MLKLQTYHVNKVPFEGPKTFKAISEQIAEDAKKEGLDISANDISSVIRFMFSLRGALNSVPYFIEARLSGFGRWIPDQKGVRLRKRYYKAKNKFNDQFRAQLKRCRESLKYSKRMYNKYLANSTAEIKLSYPMWRIASGRQEVIDQRYKELNQLRRAFYKREKNVFHYGTMKLPYRKKKYKRK